MRKLLLPLLAALLALAAVAIPAQALSLPLPPVPLVAPGPETDAFEAEDESGEDEEGEDSSECTIEDEEDVQLCAEIAAEEREEAEAEDCILEDATARVSTNPGNDTVALTVRYQADAPAEVALDARLRGNKGSVHLGADHPHFRRAGTFRETFFLGEKRMDRVLAAREFELELQAVNTPHYCRIELNGALHRAKRSLRAGAPGRSGGPAPTRGR
ncbi:MAG TPA: hypothetical protein VLK37_07765 [Solirubrobacterales bacterium]|nr:hypothetical protein [Solirubrobacterales bacterium]